MQIADTLGPLVLLWYLMSLALNVSLWLAVPLAAAAGVLLVRVFIIFHDCGHGSFFRSRRANDVTGFVAGMLTLTPYYQWRWQHAQHHATAGHLDQRGTGDVWTMTVQEYLEASRWKRFAYRLARNPFVLFVLAPLYMFAIHQRIPSAKASTRERHSVWWMNLAIAGMAVALGSWLGFVPYLVLQLVATGVAGAAGIWLFYVQHQFEDAYWDREEDWDYTAAALQGSSFYELPRVLRWLSGNIGFHHIHHLSPRVPNYNLERCHRSARVFQDVEPLTLFRSLRSMRLHLWDEAQRRLVTFRHAVRERRRARRARREETGPGARRQRQGLQPESVSGAPSEPRGIGSVPDVSANESSASSPEHERNEMSEQRNEMMQIATGYWLSKAVFCAARAGVADRLAAGPKPVAELAATAAVDEESLYRVLRGLASVGIFRETDAGVFALTDKAEYLRDDHPQSMKHFALMVGDDLYEAWCDLYHAVQTGHSAVEKRFGRDFFSEIARDLQKSHVFDRAMQEIHGGETALMLEAYDFSRFETVLDVGGGNGSTLCGLLQAHPGLHGQLFDLPSVTENARGKIAEAGLSERVEIFSGDFFEEVRGRADGIVMRHVIHDWDDARSTTILRNARAALAEGGRLLIAEKVITPGNEPGFAKLLDLNMLAIGGKERTEAQYRDLLEGAGLRLQAIHVTPGPIDVVEALV